jgi:hypothetical protein
MHKYYGFVKRFFDCAIIGGDTIPRSLKTKGNKINFKLGQFFFSNFLRKSLNYLIFKVTLNCSREQLKFEASNAFHFLRWYDTIVCRDLS